MASGRATGKCGACASRACVIVAVALVVVFAVCAAVGAVVYFFVFTDDSLKDISKNRVIIVGGGLAGLTAAKELDERDVQITIITSSQKLGGRIRSQSFGGITVELGNSRLPGTKRNENGFFNPLNKKIEDLGLTWKETDYDDYIFRDEQGNDITSEADQAYTTFDTVHENILANLYVGSSSSLSLADQENMEGFWPTKPVHHTMNWYEYDFNNGAPTSTSASRSEAFHLQSVYNDNDMFLTDSRGLKAVPEDIERAFLVENDPRVKLGESVTKIEQEGDIVKVTTSKGVYEADYVILTVSIGVLQHNVISFSPEFSKDKTDALFKYNMGQMKQIYVRFVTPFWDDVQNILHVHRSPGYFPHITNLNKYGLGTNILLFTVTGSEAVRLDDLSDAQVQAEVMSVLRSIYGQSVPNPLEFLTYSWSKDPKSYGSFANWPPGLTGSDHQLLRKPHGRIYFAGEGYSEIYSGTSYGAIASAINQVEILITCMEQGNCYHGI